MMVQLHWGSTSITGNFRDNNEDCCFVDEQGRYFLVADGMGGQAAGETASQLAIEMVSKHLERSVESEDPSNEDVLAFVDEAVSSANSEIIAQAGINPDYHNMGTTIAFLVSTADAFYAGGVGDSRVYLLRGNGLSQLTTDHTLTQALIAAGTITPEEAETHRYRNFLYRYLGTKEGGTGTEAKKLVPESGDRLFICSDGVTDGLPDDALAELLRSENDPQAATEKIVAAAEEGGSRDNITCIVVHVE